MKVGYCFFGLPRAMELSFLMQKHYLIDPFDSDIFVHTWDINNAGYRFQPNDVGPYGENWKITHQDAPPDEFRRNYPSEPCFDSTVEDFIKNTIKPKKYDIEKYDEFANVYGRSPSPAMYYSIQRVFDMLKSYEVENNVKYDLVIMSRFDIIPRCGLSQEEIEKALNNFCAYFTVNRSIEAMPDWNIRVSDMFIFANRKSMDIYANSFETWKMNPSLSGETIFWAACQQGGLEMLYSKVTLMLLQKFTDNEIYATYWSRQNK